MVDSIKITALQDIGANIAYTTLVPVVNMAGTPTTQKANLQNLGNLILNGAGGSYFARAAQANLALSVANAAQPNITSVGTLSTLAVTGNITAGNINGGNIVVANFYYGDGGFLTNVAANGSYSNSNVANYLPTYTGNVGASNIRSAGNLGVTANTLTWNFTNQGVLQWPGGIGQIDTNNSTFEIHSTNGLMISTNEANSSQSFLFDTAGVFTAPGNVNLLGSRLNVGPTAANVTNLLNPTLVIANSGADYIQAAIINGNANGSSDWSADGAGGSDDAAWTDMGFTGYNFNDANYTITEPGDGYLFVQAYANGLGGNLVLATGDNSNTADIIFATGGFLANAEFARIDHANNVFHLTRANSGIQFYDGTIQTTAGGGGSTGNVTFDDNIVIGTGDEYGSDGLFLAIGPDSIANGTVQYLRVRGGDVPTHIHLDTGNNEFYDQYFGDDGKFVKLEAGGFGNVVIGTVDIGNNYSWSFTSDGNLILAGGNSVIQSIANSSLDPLNPNVSTMVFTPDPGYSSQALVLDPTAPGHIHLRAPGSNIDEPGANIFLGGEDTSFEVTYGANNQAVIHSGGYDWTFGNDGTLTVPFEGLIRSFDDTIVLQSVDTGTGNANSVRLATDGSLYFEGTEYLNGWFQIANDSGDANIVSPSGNISITPAFGVANAAGKSLTLQGGDADQSDFYTGTGGAVNITGGLGSSDDGGGGGPGGNVNITSGNSSDPAGVAGNINITSGSKDWVFDYTGNLSFPTNGQLVMDNGDGTIGNQGDNFVISWDNEDLVLRSVAGDVDVESNTDFNVKVNYDGGAEDYLTKWVFSSNNEIINITGNSSIITEAGDLNLQGGRDTLSNGNVQITAVNTGVAVNTWTFGNDGRLTFPGTPRIDTDADNFEVQAAEAINFEANTVVNIYTDSGNTAYQWQFGDDGNLYLPDTTSVIANASITLEANSTGNITGLSVNGDADANLYAHSNVNIVSDGGNREWTFDTTGTLTAPGDITVAGDITGTAAANTLILKAQPNTNTSIQLNSIVDSTIRIDANLEIVTDSSNTSQSWNFDIAGNLTLPGNTLAINYANGDAAFGNIVSVNLDGNTSNVLLGNGVFASIPSATIIANGNSNVSIATANGNVTISAVGNTTMTVTGTGANVTGTLTSTGKIGYASGSTVTQITSRGTSVTINALAGTIVTTSAAMVATEIDTFAVLNSSVDPNNDIVLAQIVSPNQGTYNCIANPAVIGGFNDGFYINIVNISGFTTSDETITIRFMVFKAPNA